MTNQCICLNAYMLACVVLDVCTFVSRVSALMFIQNRVSNSILFAGHIDKKLLPSRVHG